MLRQIRASAGSGKTYELTTSFLTFLAAATKGEGMRGGCGVGRGEGHAWPEILAVTFTNRAAAEMQERIIGRLKDTVLGVGEPVRGWDADRAAHWISLIVRRFGSLNVRTIDSLLHMVVRLTALELDLPPDFEPVFATDKALAPLLDEILEQSRMDEGLRQMLDDACRQVFFHTQHQGFMDGGKLRENVLELVLPILDGSARDLADADTIAEHLKRLADDVIQSAQTMQQYVNAESLGISQYFKKALEGCQAGGQGKLSLSKTFSKSCLDENLLKAAKGKASDAAVAAYARLSERAQRYEQEGEILQAALKVMPFVELAQVVAVRMPEFMKAEGVMPAVFVPRLAYRALSGEYGVSEAFCRMGTSLTHILIDEFQDTSREQWQAMHPLILEAVSKGGSLTWVGDVKQAIYGWRGGDASLFDEILSDHDLCAIAPEPRIDPLPYNRRSCESIVRTNNAVFCKLSDPATARTILSAMLPVSTPQEILNAVLDEHTTLLQHGFEGAVQDLLPGTREGYVHLQRVYADNAAALDERVQDRLLDCLDELASRRAWSDIAILVRSNGKAEQVAGWLMEQGIPVVTENSFLLAEHPLIRELTGLLHFLDSPRDDVAFWTWVSGSLFLSVTGLDRQSLDAWLATSRIKGRRQPVYALFRRDYPTVWASLLAPLYTGAGLLTPYDAIREVLDRFRVWERFPDERAFLNRLLEVLHVAESQGIGSISGFLEYWEREGRQEKAPMPETLDAVRVMTMHKSKGLQFPVVIVPWHDFSVRTDTPPIVNHADGLNVFVSRTATSGLEHYQALAGTARETLHLLYVAWTRAEEELYAFLTETASSSSRNAALNILLDHLSFEASEQDVADSGTPKDTVYCTGYPVARIPSEAPSEDQEIPCAVHESVDATEETPLMWSAHRAEEIGWRPMHWLPRLRIFRNPLQDFRFTRKRRGIFVHHCLACLQPVLASGGQARDPHDSATIALEHALRTFPFPIHDADELRRIEAMLVWYVALPDTAHWLRAGTPEQGIVDADGSLYRADLIVRERERVTVIEYKTGDPTPAHNAQLARYMRLLAADGAARFSADATHGRPEVEGFLVYLDLQQLDRQVPVIVK